MNCLVEKGQKKQRNAVQEVPEVPQRLFVAGFTSRTANLTWRHPFDGKSEIISFHIEYKKAHRESQSSKRLQFSKFS